MHRLLWPTFALLQANYQLVLPNIREYLTDIGAAVTVAGVVIGCCDVASIPGTIGRKPISSSAAQLGSVCYLRLWCKLAIPTPEPLYYSLCFLCCMTESTSSANDAQKSWSHYMCMNVHTMCCPSVIQVAAVQAAYCLSLLHDSNPNCAAAPHVIVQCF